MIGCSHKEELDMTIKEFAELCNCSTQTLRYYDSINLFKPARVDRLTGYRCYHEEQALTFVKIKNLQDASFSIEEIKGLLTKREEDIYPAFEAKIAEQEAKLQKIKQIQRSYRKESMEMQERIKGCQRRINEEAGHYDPEVEFGITQEYYDRLVSRTNHYFEAAMDQVQKVDDFMELLGNIGEPGKQEEWKEEEKEFTSFGNSDYEVIYERHCWEHVKEALTDMPQLEGEYCLYFEQKKERLQNMAFLSVVLALVLDKNEGKRLSLECHSKESKDGDNHLWIFRKRDKSLRGTVI